MSGFTMGNYGGYVWACFALAAVTKQTLEP